MKNTSKIFRRIIAATLAFILIFAFASCKKEPAEEKPSDTIQADELVVPDKKVAILVAPESQFPEDYRAAQELAAEYPDTVIVKEYKDSRILEGGDPGIITISKELANNPEIGAIIYARAVQFTRNAIYKAKEINPQLVTICIEPEEDINELSTLANLVYCVDWVKAAEDIVAQVKAQGAKYFVTYSISRHISKNPLIRGEIDAFKTACEAQGITYMYESSEDTNKTAGIAGAQKYIKESVARLYLNKKIEGKDVAVFSTDSSVQSTLIEEANSRGLIYVAPSFPTAYNGLGEFYEIAKPEKINDTAAYIENVKAAVTADASGTARLSVYKTPLASYLLKSALHSTFDILGGSSDADKIIKRATLVADDYDFTIAAYGNKSNVFMAYQPGFETIR